MLPSFLLLSSCLYQQQSNLGSDQHADLLSQWQRGVQQYLANKLRDRTGQLGLLAVSLYFTDRGKAYTSFDSMWKDVCLIVSRGAKIPFFLADYLPLLLGTSFWRLIPRYRGYNESVDPRISSVFTVAFCFAHASVPPAVDCLNQNYKPIGPKIQHRSTFFAVWRIIKEGGIDPFLWSPMANQAKLMAQKQTAVDELRDQMFEQVERIGFDLPALHMQHSREHGLPGYSSWKQFCGFSPPSGLKTLAQVLRNHGPVKKFIQLHGTPKNMDVWIGALAEPFVNGGRAGPLMACLTGTQFRNVRDGDRSMSILPLKYIFGLKLVVKGKENLRTKKHFVVVLNHQPSLDSVVVTEILPSRCVPIAKKEILYMGTFGPACWLSGFIFIDCKKMEEPITTLTEVATPCTKKM